MKDAFRPSGPALPCPVCGRTKDGDCRILSDGRVFCHSERQGVKGKKCESNDFYVFLGESNEAQGAGMWKLDETAPAKAPREYGIRYFDYFFWDGTAVPAKRYRKDVGGQPKEIKWTRGGLGGRSQAEVAPYLWEKTSGAKQLFVVRGELKAELLAGRGFTAISCLNQKDELLAAELKAMRANGIEIVLVPDCDRADLDKWFKYLSKEVPGVQQLLAPGLPWSNPPADGGLGIEDWIYAKSPSNDQILAAISSTEASDQDAKDLNTLKNRILSIISENPATKDQLALARKKAQELGFSLSASEIKGYINELSYVAPVPYSSTNPMPYKAESRLWANLLLHDSTNLIVSPPKVGKSALMLHLFGCMLRGKSHCLGHPIHNRCSSLIIVGNDMTTLQWGELLAREGLATIVGPKGNQTVIPVPEVTIYARDTAVQLTEQGIQMIKEDCTYSRNSMLLIDTVRSQTSSLGLDENSREAVRPLENLFNALAEAKSKTTTIVLHHAKKSGGASAVEASAGSSAIPAAFDQTLNMNWLNPAPNGMFQTDRRVLVSSSGRGSQDQQIVVELVGVKPAPVRWIYHGNAEELIRAQAVITTEMSLQTMSANIYDHMQTCYQNTGRGVGSRAIREQFQLSQPRADRLLNELCRLGLAFKTEGITAGVGTKGGRPTALYVPHWAERIEERSASPLPSDDLGGRSDLKGAIDPPSNLPVLDSSSSSSQEVSNGLLQMEQRCPPLETEFSTGIENPPDPLVSGVSNDKYVSNKPLIPPDPLVSGVSKVIYGVSSSSSSSSLKEPIPTSFLAGLISNACGLHANDSANATESLKPELGQAVQVFRKGEWESGWTICDSRNPHSLRIRIERDGKVFQLANQRWEIDLRPELLEVPASPSKAGVGATELDTSSKAFKPPLTSYRFLLLLRRRIVFFELLFIAP